MKSARAPDADPAIALTTADWCEIATRAQSLWDRLGAKDVPGKDGTAAPERLAPWRQQAGEGQPRLFARRLAWAGWDEAAAERALRAPSTISPDGLPAWIHILADVHKEATGFDLRGIDPLDETGAGLRYAVEPDAPLPFEGLLLPALSVARRRLRGALQTLRADCGGNLHGLLAQPAYLTAERGLLRQLTDLCGKTFGFEFAQFRPAQNALLALLPTGASGAPPTDVYDRFVAGLLSQGLAPIFRDYPVLGRLLATAIEFWVEALAEFLVRLTADRDEIGRILGETLGPVTQLADDLSDPHHRGRSVRIAGFADGRRLVYKPRSVKPEVSFGLLLAWCNQGGATPPFKIIRHLDRGAYGWAIDCVAAAPCSDTAQVERFYRRAGMLLCLAYVLDANDLHSENLIAAGEHPILVDAETLMHPRTAPVDPVTAMLLGGEASAAAESVMRTGFLPRWNFDGDALVAYDVSGLGRSESQQAPWEALRWRAVNTDHMMLAPEAVILPPQDNLPTLNGTPLSPADHVDIICGGFAAMYQFLAANRADLLAQKPLLAQLRAQPVRFLFRPTEIYGAMLDHGRLPQNLRDGAARSIALDALSTVFLSAPEPGAAWPLLAAELAALEQMDVPYFATTASSRAIDAGVAQPIAEFLDSSGFERFTARLNQLDDGDLGFQLAMIRGAFFAHAARAPAASPTAHSRADAVPPEILDRAGLVAEAAAIARGIAAQVLRERAGGVTWLGLRYAAKAKRFQFEPVGVNLYDGRCGIALFLAALDFITGRSEQRGLVFDALAPLTRLLRSGDPEIGKAAGRKLGPGGGSGIGSILYALARIGSWTGEPALLETAVDAARLIDDEMIAHDDRLDVIDGAAGAILGLLALHGATANALALRRAVACGAHLVARQVDTGDGARAWRTLGDTPLTGFSHGAAGIAYALLRLHAVTGHAALREAAEAGMAYERKCYSQHAHNWPDFRVSGDQPGFAMSWCHGAPGIGLARLGGLGLAALTDVDREIELALEATRAADFHQVDHLCCGNLGLADVLLSAGARLGRPDLTDAARSLAGQVAARARRDGGYRLFGNLPVTAHNPGLFQGSAGIGYELLRLAYPDRLPSVLLWQ